MPYGISDAAWSMMDAQDRLHAQRRVENARAGQGDYGSVENAKAANFAQWGNAGSSSIVQPTEAGVGAWAPGGQWANPTPESPAEVPIGYDYGGGGGSGGGGGGAAFPAMPPRPSLASSPEWLAYLAALGLEQSQFQAEINKQRGLFSSEANRQIGDLKPQYDVQRRGITGNLESRGMARSGEFLRRISDNRAAQGRQEGGIRGALALQVGQLESQLAQKIIDINARKADRELQLRSSGGYV